MDMENVGRFTQPLMLMSVSRGLLHDLFERFREELAAAGLTPPEPSLPDEEYLRAFSQLVMSDLPSILVNSLHAIEEMADAHGRDCLEEMLGADAFSLPAGVAGLSDLEFAICAWLRDSKRFEQLHCAYHAPRQRPFTYFAAGVLPPHELHPLTVAKHTAALEALLAGVGGGAGKHPPPAMHVSAYPKGGELWFLIGSTGSNGRPRQDVVVYNAPRGELRVNCTRQHDLESFRKAFGLCLFSDAEFFRTAPRFTFAPLAVAGRACLACADIPGIEAVRLETVEFMHGGAAWHQAPNTPDLFARVERGEFCIPPAASIRRAVFEVKFTDSRHSRRVTLIAPNRVLYERDQDSALIGPWLHARGFTILSGSAGAGDSKKAFGRRWLPLAA